MMPDVVEIDRNAMRVWALECCYAVLQAGERQRVGRVMVMAMAMRCEFWRVRTVGWAWYWRTSRRGVKRGADVRRMRWCCGAWPQTDSRSEEQTIARGEVGGWVAGEADWLAARRWQMAVLPSRCP